MAARFTYSRWDGTQRGFDLDADALFDELTDDLLYHGDVNSALRRMMQEGMRDRNGERLQGLRELMDKLREQRHDRLDRYDLGGVYNEIADELNDIVDEERHAIDNATQAAERSGDQRRAQTARDAAAERNFRLDMLPDDLPAANVLQKTDVVHGARLGVLLGGIAGAGAGGLFVLFPPEGSVLPLATLLFTALMYAMAWGLWKARYWAVLGLEGLIGILLVIFSLFALRAETFTDVVISLGILIPCGALFWFLVKAMARIQMPERPR